MSPLAPTDVLPLTCTREGACCHGHKIWINPWELALLAVGSSRSVAEARTAFTDCRGLRLAFDGPADRRGLPACRIYAPGVGCTRHAVRPLTCRVYPLGRLRLEGQVRFVPAHGKLPCLEACPTVIDGPSLSVADYLAGQEIGPGEIAHDAYANLVYGLAASAAALCRHPQAGVDRAKVLGLWADLAALDPATRATVLPDAWNDRLTVDTGGLDLLDPAAFARGHGERLTQAILRGAQALDTDLTEVACLYVMLALHLAPVVGADPEAIRGLLEAEA